MKFKCDVCGLVTDDIRTCEAHERECREKYNKLLFYHEEFSKLIAGAPLQKILLVAQIPKDETEQEFENYHINGLQFEAVKNKIIIKVKPNEKPKESGKDKSKSGKDVKNK